MKVKEKRPFATQRQFMKKPKPWNTLKTKLSNLASSIQKSTSSKPSVMKCSLKAVVRRLKCLNASSTLFPLPITTTHQPMYLKYSEKWENRHKKNNVPTFPFLQRNLELCVNSWSDYEKKFLEWSAMCQQRKNQVKNQGNTCDSPEDYACSSFPSKQPQHPTSSKQSKSQSTVSEVKDAESTDENEEGEQEKKLLKSFYTVYHIDKLHKGDSQQISSLEQLANSEYVKASVQEAPKRGLHPRRYSAQEASALSPKTLMALERWRNAQGPVFLPTKSKTSQKQFRNDRGGSGDDSGEEDIGSGLDVWNRHMAHIEHAKIVRRPQPTRQNSCTQEKDTFLTSKYAKRRAQRLSFESVQSMPDISATTPNTNSKGPIITEVFSADEQEEEDTENEDMPEKISGGRALGRQRSKNGMKIEEIFDNPKQKMNASRQKSLGQYSFNSETNKENSFLVPLRLSSGKWSAKQHTQDTSSRLSDLKTISTPDLFGRLEREMRVFENRRANRPGIRGRAKLFANNSISPLVAGSKAKKTYSTPPTMATQQAGIRRSPRFSHV